MSNRGLSCSSGFSLIEAIVALVVLAGAATGVLLIFANATATSADPQIRAQARALAEGYMDEILLQRYCEDPPGCSAETGGAEEGARQDYDDAWDYGAITGESPPRDQFGNALAGLGDYTVDVAVRGTVGGGPAEITVTVRHASGRVDYDLYSERAQY